LLHLHLNCHFHILVKKIIKNMLFFSIF
jgi:hypothetical protein